MLALRKNSARHGSSCSAWSPDENPFETAAAGQLQLQHAAVAPYSAARVLILDATVCRQRYVHAMPSFAIESEDLQYRKLRSEGNSVNVPIRCQK